MPTYEYRCDDGGHEFAIEQRITDPPLTECPDPECGGKDVYRLIPQRTTFVLAGGGWAKEGYR